MANKVPRLLTQSLSVLSARMSTTEAATLDLLRCVDFAAEKHRDQRRKDPQRTPYINHPIKVAHILAHEGSVTDLRILQAAILHDTVEDTETTFEEIQKEFGEEVRGIVEEVTDDKNLPKDERKALQVEHAPGSSHSAKLVKLADKLANLRDLLETKPRGWTQERVTEYFEWSKKVVAGLRGTNDALENRLDKVFSTREAWEADHPSTEEK